MTNASKSTSWHLLGPRKRPMVVWSAFLGAMTIVGGFLAISDPTPLPRITHGPAAMSAVGTATSDTIFDTATPIHKGQWLNVIIHDSGQPHGSVEGMSREAQANGLHGLGYHFVIGNGNGMSDGELHVGYRWNEQLQGAHVGGSGNDDQYNLTSIGIVLVGDGNSRDFSPRQYERLVSLITGLQNELKIDASHVRPASDIASVQSPGQKFRWAQVREQLPLIGDGG